MKIERVKSNYLETGIDKLLRYVREKKEVKLSEASSKFNVSKGIIEDWGNILEKNKLIEMHYPIMGEPVLLSIGKRAKKEKLKKEKKSKQKEKPKEKKKLEIKEEPKKPLENEPLKKVQSKIETTSQVSSKDEEKKEEPKKQEIVKKNIKQKKTKLEALETYEKNFGSLMSKSKNLIKQKKKEEKKNKPKYMKKHETTHKMPLKIAIPILIVVAMILFFYTIAFTQYYYITEQLVSFLQSIAQIIVSQLTGYGIDNVIYPILIIIIAIIITIGVFIFLKKREKHGGHK